MPRVRADARPDPITYFTTGRTDYGLRHAFKTTSTMPKRRRMGHARGAGASRGYIPGGYLTAASYRDVMYAKEGGKGFLDTPYSGYIKGETNAANVYLANGVGPGTGTQQRIGRKIYMTGASLKLNVQAHTTTVANSSTDRHVAFAIVYDKRPNGTLPNITDIYETNNINSQRNEAGFARFRVLKHMTLVTYGPRDTAGATRPFIFIDKYIKFKKPLVCEFKSSGGSGSSAIGDIQEGALYMIAYTSQVTTGATDTDAMRIVGNMRLHFRDVMS